MGVNIAGVHIFGGAPPLPIATTGRVFWVGSAACPGGLTGVDSAGSYGDSPYKPFATLDYAVGQCAANRGDTLIVLPGHVDTIAAANGVDIDVAGLSIIGLGRGLARPQMNFTATTSTFRVNAASTYIENLRFTGGIDAVAAAVDINGVTDCTLKNIEFRDVTGEATKFLHARDGSDRLTLDGVRVIGAAGAGATHALTFDGCDDLILRNFKIVGNFSTAAVGFITTLSARVDVRYGYVWNQNAADIAFVDTITGSTGQFSDLALTATDNAANVTEMITGATFHIDKDTVYVVNAVNEKAIVINWAASADL